VSLKRVCAWCQADLGEVDNKNSGVTHGICPACLIRLKVNSILRTEHLIAGLTLEEDDHVLLLKKEGQVVAYFTHQAEKESILKEANKYLSHRS
jgi:hypothetical protein